MSKDIKSIQKEMVFMKQTKNAENKKKGNKITFRVNVIEDRELIRYIDDASNGSAFIKEAIKFYIKAIQRGVVSSFYLESTEKKWDKAFDDMENFENAPNASINDFDVSLYPEGADIYENAYIPDNSKSNVINNLNN